MRTRICFDTICLHLKNVFVKMFVKNVWTFDIKREDLGTSWTKCQCTVLITVQEVIKNVTDDYELEESYGYPESDLECISGDNIDLDRSCYSSGQGEVDLGNACANKSIFNLLQRWNISNQDGLLVLDDRQVSVIYVPSKMYRFVVRDLQ